MQRARCFIGVKLEWREGVVLLSEKSLLCVWGGIRLIEGLKISIVWLAD